ncbi:MAG: hypothetical protein PHN80_15940 [Hespellia sp.]|nr:hypothetical protein [Hespellia sp.]
MDKITLKVKECSEFETLGECHENIESVSEAVRLWKKIPAERMQGIKSIAVVLESPGNIMDGSELDILVGKHFDLEVLRYVPDILENKQAQEMIKELVRSFPDMEVRGSIPEELEKSNCIDKGSIRIGHHR